MVQIMGSDIYTESAVAVRFVDFLDRKELNKKSFRNTIVDELIKNKIVSATDHLSMRDSKTIFINKLVNLISMNDGYEDDREHNTKLLTVFCEHIGVNLDDLPECNFRSFDNLREAGVYDCKQRLTLYVPVPSSGMISFSSLNK